MKAFLLSFACISVPLAVAAQQAPRLAHRSAAANVFAPTKWSLAEAGPAVSPPKLDLSRSQDSTEDLVVYGKRILHKDPPNAPIDALTLGQATLTGTTQTSLPVIASYGELARPVDCFASARNDGCSIEAAQPQATML